MPARNASYNAKLKGQSCPEDAVTGLCDYLRALKPDRQRGDLDRIAQEAREAQARSWARKLLEAAGCKHDTGCPLCGEYDGAY